MKYILKNSTDEEIKDFIVKIQNLMSIEDVVEQRAEYKVLCNVYGRENVKSFLSCAVIISGENITDIYCTRRVWDYAAAHAGMPHRVELTKKALQTLSREEKTLFMTKAAEIIENCVSNKRLHSRRGV